MDCPKIEIMQADRHWRAPTDCFLYVIPAEQLRMASASEAIGKSMGMIPGIEIAHYDIYRINRI